MSTYPINLEVKPARGEDLIGAALRRADRWRRRAHRDGERAEARADRCDRCDYYAAARVSAGLDVERPARGCRERHDHEAGAW